MNLVVPKKPRPRLRIQPTGNVGNQMLQYMVVSNISRRVPGVELCGYDMPMWRLAAACTPEAEPAKRILGGRYIPDRQIARYFRRDILDELTVQALSLRLGQLGSPDRYRQQFLPPDDLGIEVFGSDFIVISIRAAEILADTHPDYGPIPLSLMDQVIAASGKRPVFVGQLGDDRYSEHIVRRYPHALLRPSKGPIIDFETIRRADEVLVSVSTFAWVAAWLSQASRIHLPVSGLYDPRRRPDIDLLPHRDHRYVFYELEDRPWRATEADFDRLVAERSPYPVMSSRAVRSRKRVASIRFLKTRARVAVKLAGACRRDGQWRI